MLSATRALLFFQLFLLVAAIASVTKSDILRSGMTRYRVTPTDPYNASKVAATEALLRQQYGDTDVQMIPDENNLTTWLIASKGDNTDASIKQIDGVSTVTTDTSATFTKREQGGRRKQSDLAKPPPKPPATVWNILATNGTDLKETEAYLKTKIEPDTKFFAAGKESHARGWGNVTLTDAAKAEVEKHEGVADMGPAGELVPLLALPGTDPGYNRRPTTRKMHLTDRATTQWQKQESPDWSLSMDSAYP